MPHKSCVERLIALDAAAERETAAADSAADESDGEREIVSIGKKSDYWDTKRLGDKLQGLEKVDPYGLLELDDRRWRASADELRKSYRRLVLEKHPDKKVVNERSPKHRTKAADKAERADAAKVEEDRDDEGEEDQEDEEFKLLSAAWELLGNEEKRRQFDSIDYFNDNMPTSYRDRPDDPDRFYRIFGAVFSRQSKFSTVRPVPQLGDADTPVEEVQRFYQFWGNFKSWRDFTLLAEYDTSEAGDREERRWMVRMNKNEVDRLKRHEMKRLFALVELAQENDPRLLKAKAQRAAEKERIKAEKEAALAAERKAKEDIEKAKKEASDKEKAEAVMAKAVKDGEKATAKREKEKLRSALKKARKELKALGEVGAKLQGRAADLEVLASGLPVDQIEALTAALGSAEADAGASIIDTALKNLLG